MIHPLCREADGWSTALSVLGPEAGLLLADRHGLAVRYQLREGVRDGERLRSRCSRAWVALTR